jgi:hypothetical protein
MTSSIILPEKGQNTNLSHSPPKITYLFDFRDAWRDSLISVLNRICGLCSCRLWAELCSALE